MPGPMPDRLLCFLVRKGGPRRGSVSPMRELPSKSSFAKLVTITVVRNAIHAAPRALTKTHLQGSPQPGLSFVPTKK